MYSICCLCCIVHSARANAIFLYSGEEKINLICRQILSWHSRERHICSCFLFPQCFHRCRIIVIGITRWIQTFCIERGFWGMQQTTTGHLSLECNACVRECTQTNAWHFGCLSCATANTKFYVSAAAGRMLNENHFFCAVTDWVVIPNIEMNRPGNVSLSFNNPSIVLSGTTELSQAQNISRTASGIAIASIPKK